MSDCWVCDVIAAIERATGTGIVPRPDLVRVERPAISGIISGRDLARDPRLKDVEMQLRAVQDIPLSQKAQMVAEGLRQIGEHTAAAQISEAIPQIAAAEQNTPSAGGD
jgi:hypothetical protein